MQYDGQHQNAASTQKTIEEQQSKSGEIVADLTKKLEAEQIKSDEYLEMLRRTQADFINYRRRTGQEQGESRTTAQIAVLDQLLPVLDDLKRALEATPPELTDHPWIQGIRLVAKRLTSTLDQLGVQEFGKPGEKFDPRWHEALMTEVRSDKPEGTILHIAKSGYTLGERIIRPAQVVVIGSDS